MRCVLIAMAAASLLAQGANAADAGGLSETQIGLVREFLEVTETGGGVAPLREVFMERIDRTYPQTFQGMLDELSLPAGQRADAEASYAASLARFRASFARLFDEQVDLDVLARILYAPIYTRHLSEDDLRELIAFYRTPVGQKSLRVLPHAMNEISMGVAAAMAPVITSLVNEAVALEKRSLVR